MLSILTKFFAFHSVLIQYKPLISLASNSKDDNGLVQCNLSIQELSERHPNGNIDLDFIEEHAEFLLDNLGKQVDANTSVILLSSIGIICFELNPITISHLYFSFRSFPLNHQLLTGKLGGVKESKIRNPFQLRSDQYNKYDNKSVAHIFTQ